MLNIKLYQYFDKYVFVFSCLESFLINWLKFSIYICLSLGVTESSHHDCCVFTLLYQSPWFSICFKITWKGTPIGIHRLLTCWFSKDLHCLFRIEQNQDIGFNFLTLCPWVSVLENFVSNSFFEWLPLFR